MMQISCGRIFSDWGMERRREGGRNIQFNRNKKEEEKTKSDV